MSGTLEAVPVAGVQISIDNEPVELPFNITQDSSLTTWDLQDRIGMVTTWDLQGPITIGGDNGVTISAISAAFSPNPFIGYAIAVIDVGAPSTFSFIFATPIIPQVAPGTITSGYSGSLTDGGQDGVSITPAAPGVPTDGDGIPEVHVVTDGFDAAGALVNDGVDLGPAASFPGGIANVHGPFNEVAAFPGPGPWTWLQINVSFEGSGGGDFYALSGRADKEATSISVPDSASTLMLSLVGFGCCALSRRLRVFTR
jgi:hypothetical protein